MRTIVLLTGLLHLLCPLGLVVGAQTCAPKPSCRECIQSPGCHWCSTTSFVQGSSEQRCDTAEALTKRGCPEVFVPDMDIDRLKDHEFSDTPGSPVQLKPQIVHIPLRVGVPQTFKVSFKRAEGYPIDLYYLMDLSFSMGDDLDTIKHLSEDIVSTLQDFTRSIRIGFGSFVDKVALPFVSQMRRKRSDPSPDRGKRCQPAISYQNILSLTNHMAEFKSKVSGQRISANLDSPEAGFDAIMQAAVCKDAIGWGNVTKILVYTSDDTFHVAGDGRLAGIYEPHDGRCHLSPHGSYDGTKYDYPSIGHLARVLTDNNIQLIFAVTQNISAAYEELSKMIPQSVVGVLESDSRNVVQLITNAYNSLSSSVVLEAHGAPQGLQVSYQAHCIPGPGAAPWGQKGECKDIKLNQQVDFTVQLNISKCLKEKTEFHLSVQGIAEKLKVTVETKCQCKCESDMKSSPQCGGNGTLLCGVCSCDSGFQGQRCECEQDSMVSLDACRQGNSSQQCSGHGRCECGTCLCHHTFTGKFCECDPNNCAKSNQKLCGGNGNCSCSGKCECSPNYEGDACDCSKLTNQCETGTNRTCSGHGECRCNKCNCRSGFFGDDCSSITIACEKYDMCVKCISEHEGSDLKDKCLGPCESDDLSREEELPDADCSNQYFMYSVRLSPSGAVVFHYAEMPRSVDKTLVIIGSSVSSIIFIGLAVILISRLLLELHYRREYASFLKSQKHITFEDNNPLFQKATTTVVNPLFEQGDDSAATPSVGQDKASASSDLL